MTQVEQIFRTRACVAHGHKEITLRFAKALPVPGIESMLLRYFEGGVARGTEFKPGQTVQVGWSLLRICERADGTLGVQERTADAWTESVHDTLMDTWMMKEVADSLDLVERLAFPTQNQLAVACTALHETDHWVMTRSPTENSEDSGWFVGCLDDHDHDVETNLAAKSLLQLGWELPLLRQFFALPAGIDVAISSSGLEIFWNGKPLTPKPGSYLAAVIAKRAARD